MGFPAGWTDIVSLAMPSSPKQAALAWRELIARTAQRKAA